MNHQGLAQHAEMDLAEEEDAREQQTVEEEVDALFQKTQQSGSVISDNYNLYVPLAVRMESPTWGCLVPSADSNRAGGTASQIAEEVVFPTGMRVVWC